MEKPEPSEDVATGESSPPATEVKEPAVLTRLFFDIDTKGNVFINLVVNDPTEESAFDFGQFLAALNHGAYASDICTAITNLAEKNDNMDDFAEESLDSFMHGINTIQAVVQEDELVVKPSEFIRYPGFAGGMNDGDD